MSIIGTLRELSSSGKNYKAWEDNNKQNEYKRKELLKTKQFSPESIESARRKAEMLVDNISIMDQRSETFSQDIEAAIQVSSLFAILPTLTLGPLALMKHINKCPKVVQKVVSSLPVPILGTLMGTLSSLPFVSLELILQKKASRVGRYMAQRDDLKNPANFAVLSEVQKVRVNNIAQNMSDDKVNEKLKRGNFIDGLKNLFRFPANYGAYKKHLKESEREENELKKNFVKLVPNEALCKAQRDKKLIMNLANKIDMKSQEYSENVEFATNTILIGGFIPSGMAGALMFGVSRLIPGLKQKFLTSMSLSVLTSLVVEFGLLLSSLGLIKNAAQLGRFVAKKEILNNPENYLEIRDEELKNIPDKNLNGGNDNKKGVKGKIKLIKTLFKDYFEYKKYNKEQLKKDLKYKEALNQIKLTPEQEKEAKQLQKNTFRVFDKTDSYSEEFAEDVESLQGYSTPLFTLAPLFTPIAAAKFKASPKVAKVVDFSGFIASLLGIFGLDAFITKKQIQATKIAHMKADKELNDPRLFVDYSSLNVN